MSVHRTHGRGTSGVHGLYVHRVSSLWVAQLLISERMEEKINSKHWVTVDEVVAAVECVPGLSFSWDVHPERGERALVKVRLRRADGLVVLYDVGHPLGGVWNLGTVYRT